MTDRLGRARNCLVTAALTIGLVTAGGATALAATPSARAASPAGTAAVVNMAVGTTLPSWNNDRDRDRHNGRDHRWRSGWHRDLRGGWRGYRLWTVSPSQCRWGHGWVDWRHDRCRGGWFSGARIRPW